MFLLNTGEDIFRCMGAGSVEPGLSQQHREDRKALNRMEKNKTTADHSAAQQLVDWNSLRAYDSTTCDFQLTLGFF